jgi:hypothetical protein
MSLSSILACSSQAIPYPNIFGAEFLSLEASLVSNFSAILPQGAYANNGAVNFTSISFCNFSLSYTHPGENDTINVQAWLPTDTWNGRMQNVGGGGWYAGMYEYSFLSMTGAIGDGYMTLTTDGGHSNGDPREWALLSPGNINLYVLQDFASISLNDLVLIGKSLALSFYGNTPAYSYWSGCSQGGRQGLMLAQRYPTAYDGIAASSPAINFGEFTVGSYWPQFVMNQLGEYPYPCELDALTAAVIKDCDGDDGILDNIITFPDTCDFDPYRLVGTTINCSDTGHSMKISKAAAIIAEAAWTGARTSSGSFLWYGVNRGAALTGDISTSGTTCDASGHCTGNPYNASTYWIQLYLQRDSAYDVTNMTLADYERFFRASVQEFGDIIGSNEADLGEFRDAGGKMVTYHGMVGPPFSISFSFKWCRPASTHLIFSQD